MKGISCLQEILMILFVSMDNAPQSSPTPAVLGCPYSQAILNFFWSAMVVQPHPPVYFLLIPTQKYFGCNFLFGYWSTTARCKASLLRRLGMKASSELVLLSKMKPQAHYDCTISKPADEQDVVTVGTPPCSCDATQRSFQT